MVNDRNGIKSTLFFIELTLQNDRSLLRILPKPLAFIIYQGDNVLGPGFRDV